MLPLRTAYGTPTMLLSSTDETRYHDSAMDNLAVTSHASPKALCSLRAHTLPSEFQRASGFI
eukprot:scaffold609898_cov41-Prasinocladus_malaysianus.AAC.1